jgi:hypothetical protein
MVATTTMPATLRRASVTDRCTVGSIATIPTRIVTKNGDVLRARREQAPVRRSETLVEAVGVDLLSVGGEAIVKVRQTRDGRGLLKAVGVDLVRVRGKVRV